MNMDKEYKKIVSRIGRNIAGLREASDTTQEQMCRDLGYTINYLSLLENGHRGIRLDGLVKIADYFGVKPGELIDKDFNFESR
jgi:transcriptional regulator with XRE-family HTH domain